MADAIRLQGLKIIAGSNVLVHATSLELSAGQVVGLLGKSGAGKTQTARALLGIVDMVPGVVAAELEVEAAGTIHRPYDGALGSPSTVRDRAFSQLRGSVLSYLPQDARGALDPLQTVGAQVAATAKLRSATLADPLPHLSRAGFARPADVAGLYPHELSGGMAQRAIIAQALARASRFLLADEPTSGLDPSIRQGLLSELRRLADEGVGVLLITHDIRALIAVCDAVVVMEHGRTVERLDAVALRAGNVRTEASRAMLDAAASLNNRRDTR